MIISHTSLLLLLTVSCSISLKQLSLPEETKDNNHLFYCALDIGNLLWKPGYTVLVNEKFHGHINFKEVYYIPQIIFSFELNPHLKWRIYYYILYFQDYEELLETFEFLMASSSWNPRARFILILRFKTSISENILNYFKSFYVWNLLLLIESEQSASEIQILSWSSNDLSEIYTNPTNNYSIITTCKNGTVNPDKKSALFPIRRFITYDKFSAIVGVVKIPPYVVDPKLERHAGLEISLLRILAEKLNFSLVFIDNPYQHEWGELNSSGFYEATFGLLQQRKIDIVIGMWHSNYTQSMDFDVSFCYMEDSLVWIVPSAKMIASWKNIAYVVSPELGKALLATGALAIVACLILKRTGTFEEPTKRRDTVLTILKLFGVQFGMAIKKPPKATHMRIFLTAWLIYTFVISSFYSSQLISVLTEPVFEHQISTFDELLNSGLKLGFHYDLIDFFDEPQNPKVYAIHENFVKCPLTEGCVNRTAFKRDFATAKNRRQVNYLRNQYYTAKNGRPLIYDFKEPIFNYPIQMVMVKGLPIYEDANKILMRIKEAGIIENWYLSLARWQVNYRANKFRHMDIEDDDDDESFAALTVDHMQAPLAILAFGLVSAFVVFVIEKIIPYCFSEEKKITEQFKQWEAIKLSKIKLGLMRSPNKN